MKVSIFIQKKNEKKERKKVSTLLVAGVTQTPYDSS